MEIHTETISNIMTMTSLTLWSSLTGIASFPDLHAYTQLFTTMCDYFIAIACKR